MNENKSKSLLAYSSIFSNERDTISLYFELCGFEQILIHRCYYNSNQFQSLFDDRLPDDQKIDIRESNFLLNIDQFKKIMTKFANDKKVINSLGADFANGFTKILNNLSFSTNEVEKSQMIDKLNDLIFGYQYKAKEKRHLFNNKIIIAVNDIIKNNSIGKIKNDITIKPDLIEEYKDNHLMQLRIYKVGQANCSALIKFKNNDKSDYNVVVVFDFGFQRKSGKNKDLEEMINKIDDKTTIIISHFDSDHINNITKYDRSKTCRWLFPKHDPKSVKGHALYQALIKIAAKKSMHGVLHSYHVPYNLSNFLQVHQNTKGKIDRYQSTTRNAECIIASLTVGEKNVLIPADALYDDFPSSVTKNKYTDVIIPHHCCFYPNRCSLKMPNYIHVLSRNCTDAYIMSGKNSFGHADIDHLSWYKKVNIFNTTKFSSSYTPPSTKVVKTNQNFIAIE